MKSPAAQARALAALARLHIADREALEQLAALYASTRSAAVQQGVAEIFLRSGSGARALAGLAEHLRRHRLPAAGPLVDAVLERLQSS